MFQHMFVYCHNNYKMTPTWVIAVVILRTAAADVKQQRPVTDKPALELVIYNWQRMTFTRSILSGNTTYLVRRRVHENLVQCPGESTGTCEYPSFDDSWTISMIAMHDSSNTVVADYIVKELQPKFVKPDGVTDLKLRNVATLSALVTWRSPKSDRRILYRVNLTDLDDGNSTTVVLTTLTRFNLTNLSPSTTYNASVDCRPLFANGTETGFWSERRTLQFTTSDDVPAAGPPVTAGSFRINHAGDIEVFWQEIPAGLRNGIIVATRVTCCSTGNCSSVEVSGDTFTATLKSLAKDVDYNITISSRTSAGFNSSLTLEPILIAKDRNKCAHLGGVGVIDNNSEIISVRWFPCRGAVRYTVYWEKGCPNCQTQWRAVSGNETSLTVAKRQHSKLYRFAMSVEHNAASGVMISSGMTQWSSCLHDATRPPPKPDHFHFSRHQSANSLTVEWRKPTDDECRNTGFISHYVLEFCRQTTAVFGCDGDTETKQIVANVSSYVIQNLDADVTYIVRAKSCSDHAESGYTDYIHMTVMSTDDNTDNMNIVCASAVVPVLTLALFLTILWARKLKFLPIQITPPSHDEHFRRLESVTSSETSTSSSSSPSARIDISDINELFGLDKTAVDIYDALPVSCYAIAVARRQHSYVNEILSAEGVHIPIGTRSTSAQDPALASWSAIYINCSSPGEDFLSTGPYLTPTTLCLNADMSISSAPVSVPMMLRGSGSDDEDSAIDESGCGRMVGDSFISTSSSEVYRAASLLDEVELYSVARL